MKTINSGQAQSRKNNRFVKTLTRFLVLTTAAASFAPSFGNRTGFESRESIFAAAQEGVMRLPEISALSNPQISGSKLDSRVRLAACPGPLIAEPANRSFRGGRLTMKVSCETQISWSIYVPVTVTSDITVVKVNRSLARGSILNERDLQELIVQRAPGHLPIINHIEEAIGTALKRPLREGTELQHSMLEAPVIIKRGEQTVIEAGNDQFMVRMTGKALQDGAIGEQIRVQNIASKRTIQGEVQANGSVAVLQW